MHSPSTASGVATALRASKSRQNHSSVCSGSPLRSRPVKGQPPAPNARLGAAPPCELQPRRWPTQLTLREACPGSGIKGGVFFRPSISRALLPATRCQSSGPLGALLSSPALDVRLMTALQVLQVPTQLARRWVSGCGQKRKKENRQPRGEMRGRHAATAQGF